MYISVPDHCLSVYFTYQSFEGRMWDLIVSVPDHCLFFYFLYVHIVAQVNLGMKVETNCLRDSNLIPRHSFLSTT